MKKDDKQKDEAIEKENKETEQTLKEKELDQKLEECENRYKRALADYQNLEKRLREERIGWIQTANKDLILRILPILDTLIIASRHSKETNIKIILDQFLDILKQEGILRIDTKDKNFDPKLMECVETVEAEDGKVTEEVRPGYTLSDKLIRPALVKVGKKI